MRHRKFTFKIGRSSGHRRALLANQVCSLIYSGEIRTTVVKAKQTKRVAEKMVTLAKRGGLHCRRQAIAKLREPEAVKVLFDEIGPRYTERPGGYTRIIRLGQRVGDGAEVCLLQWVEEAMPSGRKKRRKRKKEAQVEASDTPVETAAEETAVVETAEASSSEEAAEEKSEG